MYLVGLFVILAGLFGINQPTYVIAADEVGSDLVWFDSLEVPPINLDAFSVEPEPDYETNSAKDSQIELSLNTISTQEKLIWSRLLNSRDIAGNTYTLLSKLSQIYQGKNIRYSGIGSDDIEALLRLKKLRLAKCSPKVIKKYLNQFDGSKVMQNPNLAYYVEFHRERQLKLCWYVFELLLTTKWNLIEDKKMSEFDEFVGFVKENVSENQSQFEYDIPERWEFVDAVTRHIISITQAHRLRTMKRKKKLDIGDVTRLLGPLRLSCSIITDVSRDFVKYFDFVFPNEDPRRKQLPMKPVVRKALAYGRFCAQIYPQNDIFFGIRAKLSEHLEIDIDYSKVDKELGMTPRKWLPDHVPQPTDIEAYDAMVADLLPEKEKRKPGYGVEAMLSLSYDTSDFDPPEQDSNMETNQEDKAQSSHVASGQEKPETDELEYTNLDIKKVEGHSQFDWIKVLDPTNKPHYSLASSLRKLQQHYFGKRIRVDHLTIDDIVDLNDIATLRMIHCSPGGMKQILNISKDDRLRELGFGAYLDFYLPHQANLCWSIFDYMMELSVMEVPPQIVAKMSTMKLEPLLDDESVEMERSIHHDLVHKAVVRFIWNDPIFKNHVFSRNNISPMEIIEVQMDVYEKPCRFVSLATNEYYHYFDVVTGFGRNELKHAPLSAKSRLWLAYGRICGDRLDFHHIYGGLSRLLNKERRLQTPPMNDGLTFIISPKTNLETTLTYYDDRVEKLKLALMEDDEKEFLLDLVNDQTFKEPLILYDHMRRFMIHHEGENFQFGYLTARDMDLLLRIKPIRMANCLAENMAAREHMFGAEIVTNPKLKHYIENYMKRADEICYKVFISFFAEALGDLEDKIMIVMKALVQAVFRNLGGVDATDPELHRGEKSGILIDAISSFFWKNPIFDDNVNSFIRSKLLKNEEDFTPSKAYELIDSILGRPCYRIIEDYGPFVDHYDRFFASERRPLSTNLRQRISGVRLCRIIFLDDEFFMKLYAKFGETDKGLKFPAEPKFPQIDNIPSYWRMLFAKKKGIVLAESSSQHTIAVKADKPNPFSVNPRTESQIGLHLESDFYGLNRDRSKLRQKQWLSLFNSTDMGRSPFQIYEILKWLSITYGVKGDDRWLSLEQVNNLIDLRDMKLSKCQLSKLNGRNNLRPANKNLSEYLGQYKGRQMRACVKMLEIMADTAATEVKSYIDTSLIRSLRAGINDNCNAHRQPDYEIGPNHYCVVEAMAYFLLQTNQGQDMMNRIALTGDTSNPNNLIPVIGSVFLTQCNLINELLGDYIDYHNKILTTSVEMQSIFLVPPIKGDTNEWISVARICRAFMLDNHLLRAVYYKMINIVHTQSSVQWYHQAR